MRRNVLLLVALAGLALVALPGSSASAQEPVPAETTPLMTPAQSAEPSPLEVPELFPELQPMGCTFCNPSGYLVCQNADGTACGVPGQFRRCIVAPVCYCEWGGCLCDGATGTWNCFW